MNYIHKRLQIESAHHLIVIKPIIAFISTYAHLTELDITIITRYNAGLTGGTNRMLQLDCSYKKWYMTGVIPESNFDNGKTNLL